MQRTSHVARHADEMGTGTLEETSSTSTRVLSGVNISARSGPPGKKRSLFVASGGRSERRTSKVRTNWRQICKYKITVWTSVRVYVCGILWLIGVALKMRLCSFLYAGAVAPCDGLIQSPPKKKVKEPKEGTSRTANPSGTNGQIVGTCWDFCFHAKQ